MEAYFGASAVVKRAAVRRDASREGTGATRLSLAIWPNTTAAATKTTAPAVHLRKPRVLIRDAIIRHYDPDSNSSRTAPTPTRPDRSALKGRLAPPGSNQIVIC